MPLCELDTPRLRRDWNSKGSGGPESLRHVNMQPQVREVINGTIEMKERSHRDFTVSLSDIIPVRGVTFFQPYSRMLDYVVEA